MPQDNIHIETEQLNDAIFKQHHVNVSVARLDKIHPIISGNKLFKLYYFLEEAITSTHKTILTFGGAYSNHLVATAFACKKEGLRAIGIIRGEKPAVLSHTLQHCLDFGMQLKFISREAYDKKDSADFLLSLKNEFGDIIIIPEGGYSNTGAKGASLIMNYIDTAVTHIVCAVGTATTVSGLLMNVKEHQKIVAVPVLKGMTDIEDRVSFLTNNSVDAGNLSVEYDYHFGGYAKQTPWLIAFMNDLYKQHQLPTDFVYTGKMMFGVTDMIKKGKLAAGSNIVCLHTGGLQGNHSLKEGSLIF